MAISRSSALKINTEAWITFSIAIPAEALAAAVPVSCLYLSSLCALPCTSGQLEESLTLKPGSRRMETQVGLRSRVVLV